MHVLHKIPLMTYLLFLYISLLCWLIVLWTINHFWIWIWILNKITKLLTLIFIMKTHTRIRNFAFWYVYSGANCFKIVHNANQTIIAFEISGHKSQESFKQSWCLYIKNMRKITWQRQSNNSVIYSGLIYSNAFHRNIVKHYLSSNRASQNDMQNQASLFELPCLHRDCRCVWISNSLYMVDIKCAHNVISVCTDYQARNVKYDEQMVQDAPKKNVIKGVKVKGSTCIG